MRFWSEEEIARLRALVKENKTAAEIGEVLGRTEAAVKSKASELRIPIEGLRTKQRQAIDRQKRHRPGAPVIGEGDSLAERYMRLQGLKESEVDKERIFSDEELLTYLKEPALFFAEVLRLPLLTGRDGTRWQEMFVNAVVRDQQVLMICGRQLGKSILSCGLAVFFAVTAPGRVVLLVSPTERQARLNNQYIRNFMFGYRALEESLTAATTEYFVLKNGSQIHTLPSGNPENLRGFANVYAVFVDEACFVKKEVWPAVMPVRAVGHGKLIVTSTPAGKHPDNRVWVWWQANDLSWVRLSFETKINPLVDLEFLQREQESMDWISYSAEYEAQWIDEQACFFPTPLLVKCTRDIHFLEAAEEGWEYVMGVDVGHTRDRTAMVVLGRPKDSEDPWRVVNIKVSERGTGPVMGMFRALCEAFHPRDVAVDNRTPFVADEMAEVFPRLVRFIPTNRTRSEGFQNLKNEMEQGRLWLVDPENCREAKLMFRELQTLTYQYGKTQNIIFDHPRNGSDDTIDALSYAVGLSRRRPFRGVLLKA